MIYTIFIAIVFIAEIIIAITICQNLLKLNKAVIELDEYLALHKATIKDVSDLSKKISEQWFILAEDFVDRIKRNGEDFMLKQFSKILIGLFILSLNFKFVNKIKKSKITKTLAKGWSLIENMV